MKADLKRQDRGQELVEFAIILPFLLMLVFGIFDMGLGVYFYSALQNAAREGARFAIVHTPDEAGIAAAIEARVEARALALDPAVLTVTTTWTDETVQVVAEYLYEPFTPFLGTFFPDSDSDGRGEVTMESSSTMLREDW